MNENNRMPMDEEISKRIDKFINRPIYKKLDVEIIEKASDDDLEQIVFDNIYEKIGTDYFNEFEIVSNLSKGQRMLYSTWLVEGEVNNGGFNQYYFNPSGQFSEMAVEGFLTLQADKFADLMKRANELFLKIKPYLEKFNDGTLESFSQSYKENPLNELDTEFYDLNERQELSSLRINYIRKHKLEFVDK